MPTDDASREQRTEREPALAGAAPPPEGPGDDPPTERQLRYIRSLGGAPTVVSGKRQASGRINELLRMRGRRPLDPEGLARRGAESGAEADGDWKSAHHGLLAGLRLDLQDYVNHRLADLRAKLSDPLWPGGSSQARGPDEMVRRAEEELKQLELCRKWGQPVGGLSLLGTNNGSPGAPSEVERPEQESMEAASTAPQSRPANQDEAEGKVNWRSWLLLFAVGFGCVVVEAGANIGLLMSALPGGVGWPRGWAACNGPSGRERRGRVPAGSRSVRDGADLLSLHLTNQGVAPVAGDSMACRPTAWQ